jgi:hypothetical protein
MFELNGFTTSPSNPWEWLTANCVIDACSKQISIKILHFKGKNLYITQPNYAKQGHV